VDAAQPSRVTGARAALAPTSFDWSFPYPSRRVPVFAGNVVTTSHPLAVQAGMSMLARGGNAIDAAVASAITLVVVEPTNNGVGSDAFAIVWDGERVIGANGSGRSPLALQRERFPTDGPMPLVGWDTVTVPGAPALWADLSRRFGRLPFADLFEPALRYARDGAIVAPGIAEVWRFAAPLFESRADFRAGFLPEGRAPGVGDRFRCPGLVTSLEMLAATDCRALYEGALADRIVAHAKAENAAFSHADLATHATDWVTPRSIPYRGYELHELPPNTQGVAALVAAGVLARLEPTDSADDPRWIHAQIEAMKLGVGDAKAIVADPAWMTTPVEDLLEDQRLDTLAGSVGRERAAPASGPSRSHGDTVYLAAADETGMMVSFIQSNYLSFGSGVVVPGTGISLQNRGACFSSQPGHPNEVAPAKRPFHTIIPAFLTRGGAPVAALGLMGGAMQPQGHLQLLTRIVDHRQNPQAALDAPRWQICDDGTIGLEASASDDLRTELARRGHSTRPLDPMWFGGGQIVWRIDAAAYVAASEPRKDGHAAGF
jgi:gamma-glutamyltranspeptidase/glutathione hydrolase